MARDSASFLGQEQFICQAVSSFGCLSLPPNNTLHPTSLPPRTFVSIFEGPLGGKAAGERGRWAALKQSAKSKECRMRGAVVASVVALALMPSYATGGVVVEGISAGGCNVKDIRGKASHFEFSSDGRDAWDPETQASPPLSAGAAVSAATEFMREIPVPDGKSDWVAWSVDLNRINRERWYYRVEFRQDRAGASETCGVIVRLDGSIPRTLEYDLVE